MRTPLPKVSGPMLDALLWFYERRNWEHVGTNTSVALLTRKLVAHTRIGISPDLITDTGVAVLLANGKLRHEVGDTVREAREDGAVGTVTEVHPNHIVTTVGAGGVAAYLPVSKLPAVWNETPDEDEQDAEDVPQAEPVAAAPTTASEPEALSGLEQLHTDSALIALMASAPGENVRRRRAELLLQLPTPAARIEAVQQAHDASTQPMGRDLVDELAQVVVKHEAWRPVSCGGRYLPCRFEDGTDYGVWDTEAGAFVEIGGAGVTRWATFACAAENAISMSGLSERHLFQKSWDVSVVRCGDQIEGQDVSSGARVRGTVVGVHGPVRSPDCGGYRYLIRTDTYTPEPRRHMVFAERWI